MGQLEGQKIVVVGGSSGMGLAAAQALGYAGARLVLAARSWDKLHAAAAKIEAEAATHSLDFTDPAAVKAVFAEIGRFDHLVLAAAGPPAWGTFQELDPAMLHRAFQTKFWGHFYCARYALPHLRKDGSITFLTGGASRTAIAGTAGLAAVNGAITSMAYTLAKELAPVRVNVVSPGLVDTPAYDWMDADQKKAFFENMGGNLPVGRIGRAPEIAQAIVLLVSNGFITGALLDVDGGARLT